MIVSPPRALEAQVFQPASITAKLPSTAHLTSLLADNSQQYNSDKRRPKMASSSYQSKMVGFQSPAVTPSRSPSKRPIMITQRQKQALIDNLQLEITERARKLRAQYALQAQNLRARMELRVNRIPTAMRQANMGELYDKYLESTQQQPSVNETKKLAEKTNAPASPRSTKPTVCSPKKQMEAAPPRGTKRPSDHFSADDDKENTPDPTVPLQSKKRPKPNNRHPSNPAAVLSPKSSNSRTLAPHQSPSRPQLGSPQKSFLSHATSPLKPSIAVPVAPQPASPAKAPAIAATASINAAPVNNANQKTRTTRTRGAATTKATKQRAAAAPKTKTAPTTRAKRGVEPTPAAALSKDESRTVSAASNSSTATTVVTKLAAKRAVPSKAKGKAVTKKVPAVEAPAQGRRVLRKRG
ncbi:hypothetical protein XPA_008468 [Xanthoria parietina]